MLLVPLISPIKVAFSVTLRSVLIGVAAYSISSAVFPTSGVIISFSSGIIILFCYCAIITNHERKNFSNIITTTALVITLPLLVSIRESGIRSRNTKNIINIARTPILLGAIRVILLAILCINKRIFSPVKTLIASY